MVVGLTLVLSLDFIVPFIDYYTQDFKVNSASWETIYIFRLGALIGYLMVSQFIYLSSIY